MQRRLHVVGLALVALCGDARYDSSWAQSWPAKPIHVVVPFTAGSATDIIARTVFEQVGRQIGQPVVIESRLGAGGTTASAAVARADPDGYTAIAVSSSRRAAELPDVPTTLEAGFPDSAYNFWFGALLPAKTSRDIVERLNREIVKALQLPEVKERIVKLGGEPASLSPAEFDALVRKEIETNAIIVRASGLNAH